MKRITQNKKLIISAIILFSVSYFLFYDSANASVQLETALPPIANQPAPGTGLPEYINYLFVFGLGLITILALGQMILGGITYILAAGNAAKVEDAKDTIYQALLGLGILLVSYLLLRTINPDLVNLRNPNLTPIQFKGTFTSGENISGENISNINSSDLPSKCAAQGGHVVISGETPFCLGTDAESHQKIGFGDGPSCTAIGGKILDLGIGLYCSKSFK